MFRNKSVNVHQFAMVPSAQIPRSSFTIEHTHKTTINSGQLYPIYVDEVLPGDTFNMSATIMGRLATPIAPIMDNIYLDTFWFFVPNRLVWDNWVKFQGQQDNPDDTTDYLIPQNTLTGGYAPFSIQDYMGLPTQGQVDPTGVISHSCLPLRAYNLIWNEWFRDQNLQDALVVDKGDADIVGAYAIQRRGKRHDYFTSCLPWTQKGPSVGLPLGQSAQVYAGAVQNDTTGKSPLFWNETGANLPAVGPGGIGYLADGQTYGGATGPTNTLSLTPANLYADLSEATAATINQIRQAFQIQRLLERDARGGTRYVESLKSRFGVTCPDFRLQRPEYMGGSSQLININPVVQTSGTAGSGGYTDTPQGNLSAFGTVVNRNGFTQSFSEHGIIIGMACVRADLTYQQGMRRMWSRQTRFDFYEPVFAMLGEQAVLNKEIYCTGLATDEQVFGYQERWAEYRYHPSRITALFKSTSPTPLDYWHLAQNFTALPTLNSTFIEERPPVQRITAVGAEANGQELIMDCFFRCKAARPMPLYSVPGMIDHL